MSGGSYDYAYSRVADMADEIERNSPPPEPGDAVYVGRELLTPEASAPVLARIRAERLWFAGLMRVVSRAMRAVEWVDSSDCGPGDELAPIQAVRDYAMPTIDDCEPAEDAPREVDSVEVAP